MADKADADGERDRGLWRDLTTFWILGLCNNYGYVVMLGAAHDIIAQFDTKLNDAPSAEKTGDSDTKRPCHMLSTGVILLADIVPSMLIKLIAPFLPFWINVRVLICVILSAGGFILVGFANAEWMALLGVVFTSIRCGLGETSFLSYSSYFDKNVVSTWSSGTGGAGIIGTTSYTLLRGFDVSPRNTMMLMLIFPLIEVIFFWIVLRHPNTSTSKAEEEDSEESELVTFTEKLVYVRQVLKYMVPLALVYFFEYFINQGLFELVYFKDSFLDHAAQYRWLNVDYQIGVFISRSSVNIVQFEKLYLMAVFQFINVIYFLTEVLLYWTPTVWLVFAIVFWEGLLGGGAYVNTFYRMSKEIPSNRRHFALAIVAQSDSFGITPAGFLSMPVHNVICALPAPVR